MIRKYAALCLLSFFLLPATLLVAKADVAPGVTKVDAYTIVGSKNFFRDFPHMNGDGSINVVVEIPTGTTEKWEVTKDGALKWEFKKGKPRVVDYLGYPGNYGMIPQTLLPKELGGDGDALDVLVLGPAVPRGSVVKAKLIGMLKMLDGKEQDDKLIAVLAGTPFFELNNYSELDKKYAGITRIIETWFANYKGPGEIETKGFAEKEEGMKILNAAAAAYRNAK